MQTCEYKQVNDKIDDWFGRCRCETSGTFNDAKRAKYATVQYTEELIHACYSISGIESYDVLHLSNSLSHLRSY